MSIVRDEYGTLGSWSPAQIVALVLGLLYIVLGGVALLRTGVGASLFEPVTVVAGFQYTPLLGMIEIIVGLLFLAVGAFPAARDGVVFLGVLALAVGLLIVIEPAAFEGNVGADSAHGWLYVVTGAIAALTGLLTPLVFRRRTSYVESHGRDAAAHDHDEDARAGEPSERRTRRVDRDSDPEHTRRM